jgi:hypothetical protein
LRLLAETQARLEQELLPVLSTTCFAKLARS